MILAGHLRRAVRLAGLATERRNTIPVLAHLLIEAGEGLFRVTGTDMECRITTTAPCEGTLPRVTLDARALGRLVAALDDDAEVRLAPEDSLGRVRVTTTGLSAGMMALPAEDFPDMAVTSERCRFRMPVDALRRLITLPAHAISTEETRYYLNGLYVHVAAGGEGHVLRGVATDGHRLMMADTAVPEGAAQMPGLIWPRQSLAALRTLLTGSPAGEVEVILSDTKAEFRLGAWTLLTKAIDGTFPEYQRVVPERTEKGGRLRVALPRGFARSVETTTALSMERSRPVKFTCTGPGSAQMSGISPDTSLCEVTAPEHVAAWEEGSKPVEIGFQGRYLRALCAAVPAGFTMHVSDSSAPCRIEFEGGLAVLMPMRV